MEALLLLDNLSVKQTEGLLDVLLFDDLLVKRG